MKPVYIYDAIRTPRARAKDSGGLHDLRPHDLLTTLYHTLQERTGLDPAMVGEVVLGCVTQYGEQAANIAKTSTLYAGWPSSIGGLTVSRFCSSGVDAISVGALKIAAGQEQAVIAGGIEMMSRVPMLGDKAAIFIDPQYAATNGYFKSIVPVYNPVKDITVSEDECIRADTTVEALAQMEPAFAALGAKGPDAAQLAAYPQLEAIHHIHTAGNSPAMADAAAVTLLGDEELGRKLGIEPRARIVAAATASDDPLQVLSGCVASAGKLMAQQALSADDIDLFELHEAFAATVVKCQRDLGISNEKLNVNGGVIALGHPMGATGAIMAGVLLERRDLARGIVAASGAAGAGSALLIQRER